MARKANQENLNKLQEALNNNPGQKAGYIARLLGWSNEKVSRGLVSLEDDGVYYSEDRGRLYPFGDEQSDS